MTPQELTVLIEADLDRAGPSFPWHGRPLRDCLLKPAKRRFLNSHADDAPEEFWLVFEEGPNPGEGYMVVYDEGLNEFGLAVQGNTDPVVIGIYGGFVETLNSM
jgi:hypothetical protein